VLERSTVKTKRSGGATAAIVLFVVGVVWLAVYYVAGNNVPFMGMLGNWNIVISLVLIVASVITWLIATSVARSAALRPANPGADTARTNGFAIASLVLSLVGLSLLAIIFGHVGKSQIGRTGEGGSGVATAGLVLGYVELVASILGIVYVLMTSR